jgi:DNA-directed RNA polymerase alpha subunit
MTVADKNLTQLANLTAKLTKVHLSYLASLIHEDLAGGVMAWDTPEGKSLTREDIRDLCEVLEPSKKESLHEMPLQRLMLPIRAHNALWRRGYKTVGAVMTLTRRDLLLINNIGEGSADEILASIERLREELQ